MKTTPILCVLLIFISITAFSQKKKKSTLPPPRIKKEKIIQPPEVKKYEPLFNNEYFIWKIEKDTLLPAESPYEIVLQVNDYSATLRKNSYPDITEHKMKTVPDENGDIVLHTIVMMTSNYKTEIKNNTLELTNDKTNELIRLKIIKKNGKIVQLQNLNSKMIFTKDKNYSYTPSVSL